MPAIHYTPFDDRGWAGSIDLSLTEPVGIARDREFVDLPFTLPHPPLSDPARELRVVRVAEDGALLETAAQFYDLTPTDDRLGGRVAFFAEAQADQRAAYRLYFGNPSAPIPNYPRTLEVRRGDAGPTHYWIENDFYKIETMPRSGQIWHVWNKRGSNVSWHHNEWNDNVDSGGDPCHWAPNCWVGHPERIQDGFELKAGDEIPFIDWHYVFGWDDPETEILDGPIFFEIKRRGVVWPHPDHRVAGITYDDTERLRAEVTYRFVDGQPWFFQSSRLETLTDLPVFFIRNGQFVFLTRVFSHLFIAPDDPEIRPTDEPDVAVLRLMSTIGNKPHDHVEHSLSNVLPSKLAYYGYFNETTRDGFALFQLAERNSNTLNSTGKPTYQNHCTLLTELSDWAVYFCRAFSYTNQRFNPENMTYLPAGERYEEENVCLTFRHEDTGTTLEAMQTLNAQLTDPLRPDPS